MLNRTTLGKIMGTKAHDAATERRRPFGRREEGHWSRIIMRYRRQGRIVWRDALAVAEQLARDGGPTMDDVTVRTEYARRLRALAETRRPFTAEELLEGRIRALAKA